MVADGPDRYPKELIESAEALTKLIADDEAFVDTMQRLAELAVHAIDGAESCSVSLVKDGGKQLENVAATTERARRVDELQQETGEGPCLASIEAHETFHIVDMEQEEQWPDFCKRAAEETETRSMVSYVLRLSEDATGAMNMISTKRDAFSGEDIDTGTIFAAQAAVAMSNALRHEQDQREVAQLQEGMKTRQMIGQAVGILMSARQVDADEAFEILRTVSQNSNVKLRDIAERLVQKTETL